MITYRYLTSDKANTFIGARIRFSKEISHFSFDSDADYPAIGAFHDGKIVGMARFARFGDALHSSFTWVHHKYRGRGIATELWKKAISRTSATEIVLSPVTKAGKAFTAALKKETFAKIRVDAK